jgi:hypothetical protein
MRGSLGANRARRLGGRNAVMTRQVTYRPSAAGPAQDLRMRTTDINPLV